MQECGMKQHTAYPVYHSTAAPPADRKESARRNCLPRYYCSGTTYSRLPASATLH